MLTPSSPNPPSEGEINDIAAIKENQTNGSQVTQIKETISTDSTKLNPSGTITETIVGNEITTVIQEVIAGITYQQTIVENYDTGVTTYSSWTAL